MTMVARMMRTMTQISKMCLGSTVSARDSLMASMLPVRLGGASFQPWTAAGRAGPRKVPGAFTARRSPESADSHRIQPPEATPARTGNEPGSPEPGSARQPPGLGLCTPHWPRKARPPGPPPGKPAPPAHADLSAPRQPPLPARREERSKERPGVSGCFHLGALPLWP